MAVINTNVKALFSQMALSQSGRAQTVAMQQLSTGKRINSARDDAAGMAIATRMTNQIRGLNQAVRNAGDAINLIQTAEGATNQITDMLQRMRELAVQAVNDTNDNSQRSYLDLEFQQLKQQIVQIADQTEWNGAPVLTGQAGQRVGEMPVYKATSNNQFGNVFISPTTQRNVTGPNAGQTQTLSFTGSPPATGDYLINIKDQQFPVTITDNSSWSNVMDQVKTSLQGNSAFNSISSDLSTSSSPPSVAITFNAAQGDLADISMTAADGTNIGASVTPPNGASVQSTTETWSPDNGKFLQSGALNMHISVDPTDATKTVVTASFVNNKNETIPLSGTLDAANGTVKFSARDGSRNSEVMSANLTYALNGSDGQVVDLTKRDVSVAVSIQGGVPAMNDGDMVINGVPIGASYAADDTLSPPDNAAGSAIAKAAAINRKAADSGVTSGEVQTLTLSGAPDLNSLPTDISVGGVTVSLKTSDNTSVLAAAAISAALQASPLYDQSTGRSISYQPGSSVISINYAAKEGDVASTAFDARQSGLSGIVATTTQAYTAVPGTGVFAKVNENVMTGQAMTGTAVVKGAVYINGFTSADITSVFNNPRDTRANVVRAINMISDKTGVKAIDTGSDVQGVTLVAADGRNVEVRFESNDAEFGARTGLKEGVQAGTISLESKIQAPVVITSRGNINNSGFIEGNFTKNESVMNTAPRPAVAASVSQVDTFKIGGSDAGIYSVTVNGTQFNLDTTTMGTLTPNQIRDQLMDLVNAKKDQLGVTASAGDSVDTLKFTANVPGIPFTMTGAAPTGVSSLAKNVVPNTPAPVTPLSTNDLMINGVQIRATTPQDDLLSSTVSTSSSNTASAIALASAINSQSPETGVRALANPAVSEGIFTDKNSPAKAGQYSLFINGTEVSVYLDPVKDTPASRLTNVMNAINQRTGEHGVTASDNGKGGLTLTTDGRNLSVWFDSSKNGLSAASFGLDKGGAVAQVSTVDVSSTPLASNATASFKINDQTISVTGDGTTSTAVLLKAAIDAKVSSGDINNLKVDLTGNQLTLTSQVAGSGFTVTGAAVSAGSTATLDIATPTPNDMGKNDVTAIYKATAASTTAKTEYGTVRMISDPALLPIGVPAPDGAPPSDQLLKQRATGKPFTVTTGIDGLGSKSNFEALGFQVGSFGGQSSEAMDPPRVGRMSFQVGSSANQVVTIDLADFGKNGPITSEITGDVDLNVDARTARINTGDGATAMLAKLDLVMDRVNATRATMGAVMNRLDHVVNNLTNVSMNLSESRSHIEDADYAAASTELAKTQIMQQAATAVLAQANTSQQSVLKLLGG